MQSHADLARVTSFHTTFSAILDKLVSNALEHSSNLGPLMTKAFDLAACERRLGMPERMQASMRLGVQAGLAIFAGAPKPHQPFTYTLGTETVTGPSMVDESTAHTGRWEQTFYGAAILGDGPSLRAICAVPESLPRSSSTRGPGYLGLWLGLLRELGTSGNIDGERLIEALEATDPDLLPEDDRDAALYLRVPAIEALYRIALGDAEGLNATLAGALDKHRSYWTLNPEHARATEGYVSWPLSALAEIARGRGLAVDVQSDYLIRRS